MQLNDINIEKFMQVASWLCYTIIIIIIIAYVLIHNFVVTHSKLNVT